MNSDKSKYGCLALILIIILLLAGRIVYVRLNREAYPAKYPIVKIERSFEWLIVEYAPNESISKIVNTDVFNGLNPGMSKSEYHEILGEPFERHIEDKTVEVYVYRTSIGEIEIVDGFYRYDEGDESIKYIKLKPIDASIEQVVGADLTRIIQSNGVIEKVSIHKSDKPKGITIYLKESKIDFIMWDES